MERYHFWLFPPAALGQETSKESRTAPMPSQRKSEFCPGLLDVGLSES
jgi:hypothetical protein